MIPLYSFAIFLSAALLFLVQPLYTRLLLPMLGGAPGAWNTAQVFFQLALLAGYGYAHLSTRRLGVRRQALVHLGVLLLPLLVLPWNLAHAAPPPPDKNPVPWLLSTMLTTVGPPFFVLSATGPLLQRWFAATPHKRAADPYFLYAASNLGSLLALLAYPLLIEPRLHLTTQTKGFAYLYITLIALLGGAALLLLRSPVSADPIAPALSPQPIPKARVLRWLALAAIPSSLTLATTTTLTTYIVSTPLLWVIPLSLYLLTFILAFLPRPILPQRFLLFVAPLVIILGVIAAAIPLGRPIWLVLALSLFILFILALTCHGEIAKDRPSPEHLTAYFFWISLGGVLGSAFSALLAPLLFRSVLEYGITLVFAAFIVPARTPRDTAPRLADLGVAAAAAAACFVAILLRRDGIIAANAANALGFGVPMLLALKTSSRPIRLGLSFAALLAIGQENQRLTQGVLLQDRSFFGALKITETDSALAGLIGLPAEASGRKLRSLYHGITLHGVQTTAPEGRDEPLAYYTREGPIGQVFAGAPLPEHARIAVVGLGVGTLLAYAEPGQQWTLYELDPDVAAIAKDPRYFTYLADAKAPYTIVLGDARRSLARSEERYSLIILDAYSADTVPVHLLTKEALSLYLSHLEDGGLIAAHISNRHIDLGPVVFGISEALGLACVEQSAAVNLPSMAQGRLSSRWAIITRRREDLGMLESDARWGAAAPGRRVVWTDDFSSLLPLWRRE